ncbi:MAG: hypothetical protein Q8L54_03960 [Devosia sp.]|nr:hypothetical protein [Devosia sp.]
MTRTVLWLIAGGVLGGVIHLAVILGLPSLAANAAWVQVDALDALGKPAVLPAVVAGEENPLRLDPELAYAVCRLDLRNGAGIVRGVLPLAFWSVAVYGRDGAVLYSTTNRDGIGQSLELGIFNQAQTRLLAQQQLDVAEGLLIVESRNDDVFVVVRLAPPHQAMRKRYEAALETISCTNVTG